MNPSGESIAARFVRVAAEHSERVAISTPEGDWTYAELERRSAEFAGLINERAGDATAPVALVMEHGAPLIAAILGVLRSGRMYVSLDPLFPQAGLVAMIQNAQPSLVVTDKVNAALARGLGADSGRVVEISEEIFSKSGASALPDVSATAGAWLMYTSGSTGTPKGVWQNHAGVMHHARVYADLIQLRPEDRLTLMTSTSLAASTTHLFTALLHGATLCPFHLRSQGVERLSRWLKAQRVNVYHSVPTVFRYLMRAGATEYLSQMRAVRLGGEPLLRGDVELFQQHCAADAKLINALSSTETGLFSAVVFEKKTIIAGWRIPVGRPMGNEEIALLDEAGKPVTQGAEGRIAVKSGHLAQGYWRRDELTSEVFKSAGDRRMFVTGDVGRFLPDGSLEHLGRMDRLVKIRGQRVDLAEVEVAIRANEGVQDVAVIAPEGGRQERRVTAYVVLHAGKAMEGNELRRALRVVLPTHMVPDEVVTLERLPQTPGGKLDLKALPSPPERKEEKIDRDKPMPRDGIEQKLATIWESILGLKDVGRRDDFFDLGGTSIQSAQLLARVEEIFNVTLSPSTLLEYGNIEALAELLAERAVIRTVSPLVRLRAAESGQPLFLIHPGRGDLAMYGQLVRQLPERTIYGVQAVGLQGEGQPMRSIPAMARRYVQEILAVDKTGPYHLAGTCMGGLIVFEMAQELRRLEKPLGIVALMNANHPGAKSEKRESLTESVRDFFRVMRWSVLFATGLARKAKWLPACRHFVQNMHSRARRNYRPGKYRGSITVIATTDMSDAKTDLRLRMIEHARRAQTISIEGNRASLFVEPNVSELAGHLQAGMAAAEVDANRASVAFA